MIEFTPAHIQRIYEVAEAALGEARERMDDFGAVNWGDLGVVEIERRECLLTGYGLSVVVLIGQRRSRARLLEEGTCAKLQAFVAERLRDAGFPDVAVELEW